MHGVLVLTRAEHEKLKFCRNEDPDPFISGLPDPDPLLFSPDPTYPMDIKNYFHLEQNINQNHQIQATMIY